MAELDDIRHDIAELEAEVRETKLHLSRALAPYMVALHAATLAEKHERLAELYAELRRMV